MKGKALIGPLCSPRPFGLNTPWKGNESNTLQDDYWVAFGQGPRACPGVRWGYLTMKCFITSLLKKYEINPCSDTPTEIPNQKFVGLKMTADKNMIVHFNKRTQT